MSTSAQLTANRANAEHSTGPKTDAGKAIVSQNHLTHGLSIRRHIVLPTEDHAQYESLVARYCEDELPGCAIERSLINLLAECQWRIDRCNRIEYQMVVNSGLTIEEFYEQNEAKLQRFERYAGNHRRDYSRILRDFLAARSARRKHGAHPECEPLPELQNEPRSLQEPPAPEPPDSSKPISARIPYIYANELVGLRRLHPDFDPTKGKKLMSMSLRDYLKHPGNLYAAQKLVEVA
ncbi:MAG: hypothetical protein ABI693_25075 [Bryobacteraceae bacterium]